MCKRFNKEEVGTMTEGARDFRGKGRAFRGIFGGESYRRLAALFGFQERFYRRAVGDL